MRKGIIGAILFIAIALALTFARGLKRPDASPVHVEFDDVEVEEPVPRNAVPEPTPLAISLIFLGGLSGYILVRRRS